ncbi:hypothetical protein BDK51DRAFT_47822 [Blyttiomyces helicus]|uniref:Arrestin C-terminal-like domain-containing protein n=1 Tax=Blyttiomyces helicus TaxID=388810 RepID=A0A4P9WLJ6_9FUNG|nr:hypothetical protein BDK51DRAFT_47822 [Blyttiomyces helicus]|eukprot:RKO91526.1 hypothetical protein BDK51DRAFT_47822 [Blyttiomyces helicus]
MPDSFVRIELPPCFDLGAGQGLSATVRLDVMNDPLNANEGITISFYGAQRIAYDTMVSERVGNETRSRRMIFHPGSYAFPFLIMLPANLPVPFSYSHGDASASMSYFIEAKARTGLFKFDIKSGPVPIRVIPPPYNSNALSPVYTQHTNAFMLGGSATVTAQTQRNAFVVGYPIIVDLDAVNDSSKKMKHIQIELHQIAKLQVGGHSHKDASCALTTVNFPGIGKLESGILRAQLPVPAYATPTVSTQHVTISYEVRVRLAFSMAVDPVAAIPITILSADSPPLYIPPHIAEAESSPVPAPTFGDPNKRQPLAPPPALAAFWVRIAGPAIIPTALRAGSDVNGSPLYIARAFISGSYQLGKAGPTLPTALFSYAGHEVPARGEYEVLVPAPGLGWAKSTPSHPIPDRALPLGVEASGELLYVVRAKATNAGWLRAATKESLCPGKTGRHLKGAYLPFDGKECVVAEYEVLVQDNKMAVLL